MNKNVWRFGAPALVVALIALWWSWADLYSTNLGNFFQNNFYWLVWLLVGFIALVVGFVALDSRPGSSYESNGSVAAYRTVITVAALVFIGASAWMGWQWFSHSYQVAQVYNQAVEITEETAPEFNERAAFQVAEAQAPGNLSQDVIGDIVDTDYIADENVFTSIVERRGFLQGYAAVEVQTIDLTGRATAQSCTFSEDADARLGGNFSHSLERQIAHQKRGLIIDDADAYGYCDEGTPYIVVPVTNHEGWFPAVEIPAGVFVYNGSNGDLTFYDTVEAGEIPGPVFPNSLAVELRESTAAAGSYWDYVKERVGYQDTSGDEGDPNGSNRSEFALEIQDGSPTYATPLTLRGRSTAIAALGVVDAGTVTAGELNTYTVYRFSTSRQPNSAVADRIKSDYADLPDWAAGMTIFEIAPVSSTEWVASLGREQNVNYRVRIQANGDSCLLTAEGTEIRCGKRTAENGNGPGVALAPGENGTGTVILPQSPEEIAALTDAELAQLQAQLSAEISNRLNTVD